MENTYKGFAKVLLLLIFLVALFALGGQFYLILQNRVASVAETITRFFSFFTILSNMMVAVCAAAIVFGKGRETPSFAAKPGIVTAVTLYIAVTGLVYNTILRFLWQPQGFQRIVDELLHTVIPILFVLFWALYVPKKALRYQEIWLWMIYPAAYCVYSLIRGAIANFYPYPFMDAGELGYPHVLLNICGMILLFIAISLILVFIGKKTGGQRLQTSGHSLV